MTTVRVQTSAYSMDVMTVRDGDSAYNADAAWVRFNNQAFMWWPVFAGPYSYRFTASQSFTWPFPANAKIKVTLVGGQGGQGDRGSAGGSRTIQESGTADRVYGVGGPTVNAWNGDLFVTSRLFIGFVSTGLDRWRVTYSMRRVSTPPRRGASGGDGGDSTFAAGDLTFSSRGTAGSRGGTGSLPPVADTPTAAVRTISLAPGTTVSLTVGSGGTASEGSARGDSGYIVLQMVDDNGNDFNGPGLPSGVSGGGIPRPTPGPGPSPVPEITYIHTTSMTIGTDSVFGLGVVTGRTGNIVDRIYTLPNGATGLFNIILVSRNNDMDILFALSGGIELEQFPRYIRITKSNVERVYTRTTTISTTEVTGNTSVIYRGPGGTNGYVSGDSLIVDLSN